MKASASSVQLNLSTDCGARETCGRYVCALVDPFEKPSDKVVRRRDVE